MEFLHEQEIIHTNLSPSNIFLRNSDTKKMCFLNLYHCSWKPERIMPRMNLGPEYQDNITLYDIRTRNNHFISPEQVKIGADLANIVAKKNGKIDEHTFDIQEFLLIKRHEKPPAINKQSDIYSIGAILFKLLLGRAPSQKISNYIAENKLHEYNTDSNVYEVPYFFKDYILSNDLCQIMIQLLHQRQKHRYLCLE